MRIVGTISTLATVTTQSSERYSYRTGHPTRNEVLRLRTLWGRRVGSLSRSLGPSPVFLLGFNGLRKTGVEGV